MSENDNIILLVGDLGFGLFNEIRDDFPNRFYNVGAAEQAMSDIAVGLALSGKTPIVYSITPFLLYRCFETWRTYVNHEKIKVILIGSGRDQDYEIDGFSHFAGDDKELFSHTHGYESEECGILRNIHAEWPTTSNLAIKALNKAIKSDLSTYINLTR